MLTVLGSPRRFCDSLTRRETLRAGSLALLGGFGLPELLQAEQLQQRDQYQRPGKAKNVIVLYLLGGAPTQDMFDLKPDAPSEVRGEFRPDRHDRPRHPTSANTCPLTARWMHRAALVRSVNHKAGCHNPLPSFTGYEVPLPDITITKDYLSAEHGLGLRIPPPGAGRLARLCVPAQLPGLGPGRFAGPVRMPASWASAMIRSAASATLRSTSRTSTRTRGRTIPPCSWRQPFLADTTPRDHPRSPERAAVAPAASRRRACAGSSHAAGPRQLRPHPAAGLRSADLDEAQGRLQRRNRGPHGSATATDRPCSAPAP